MPAEIHPLYRVRRTVHQMLRDRGYMVDQADIDMSEADFKAKYGENPPREALTVLVQKRDDPTDQLFVFWPQDPKVGVKPIKRYVERMNEDDVKRAILIVQQSMTAFAKQAIQEMCAEMGLVLEQFQEAELLVNITEHVLVPTHVLLSREVRAHVPSALSRVAHARAPRLAQEKATLLQKYKLKESQLPRMQHADPVARYYGLSRGQVVKIVRPSETAGKYVTYRLVM